MDGKREKEIHKIELMLDICSQKFESFVFILKVDWLPDLCSRLMVTTNKFISIYNLNYECGLYCPDLRINMPGLDKKNLEIVDSTFFYSPKDKQLIIFAMLNNYRIFYQIGCSTLCKNVELNCELKIESMNETIKNKNLDKKINSFFEI